MVQDAVSLSSLVAYEVIGYTSAIAMASSHAIQNRCIFHKIDEPQRHAQSKFIAEAMASFRIMFPGATRLNRKFSATDSASDAIYYMIKEEQPVLQI